MKTDLKYWRDKLIRLPLAVGMLLVSGVSAAVSLPVYLIECAVGRGRYVKKP